MLLPFNSWASFWTVKWLLMYVQLLFLIIKAKNENRTSHKRDKGIGIIMWLVLWTQWKFSDTLPRSLWLMIPSPVNRQTARLRHHSSAWANVFTFKWKGAHSLFEEVLSQTPLFGPLIQHKPAASVNRGGLRWAWRLNEGLHVIASEYWLYLCVCVCVCVCVFAGIAWRASNWVSCFLTGRILRVLRIDERCR